MPFNRVSYQEVVDYGINSNNTIDLVPVIGATESLVLSRIRATVAGPDAAFIYIFRIPDGGSESDNTAIAYGIQLFPGQVWDEEHVVIDANEGIAVGILNVNGNSPKVVFSAYGNLETP